MSRKVRIGIDVGGTFTDAVAIDNETYEVISTKKIPTTHKDGVATGIIQIVNDLLIENHIDPNDVVFIAHGTTQATNALLEGDVARVGIVGMGTGSDAKSSKKETKIGDIELSKGKYLKTDSTFIDSKELSDELINEEITKLLDNNCEVIVASGAFSVDDPSEELKIQEVASKRRLLFTAGHEMSELYGLKMRTATAVINASLIPKMIVTANMTEEAVKGTNIGTELMIMRCDGGVMNVEEVRKRPILTMLSGLAAGVAGALMYEKITDGIFFETGGTSVDISVIKNGKVMIKYAQVGGHKTYLQSLDVRTLGLAGGTMIQIRDSEIVDIGPRSAHIAGVSYECFEEAKEMVSATCHLISPKEGDPSDYAIVEDQNGRRFSPTLCGAANLLGYVPKGDYAEGNIETSKVAWDAVGKLLNLSGEEAAKKALDMATEKLKEVVDSLIEEYELDPKMLVLVGGGGSAPVLVPALAEKYGENMKWKVSNNAPYISTIGVALAMVRETLERSIGNPSKSDIKEIRQDIIEKIVKSGALEETVDVSVEVDAEHSILRAIATGATELRSKDMGISKLSAEELQKRAVTTLNFDKVAAKGHAGRWSVFSGQIIKKKFFGLIKSKQQPVAVLDNEGVARFKNQNADYLSFSKDNYVEFDEFLYDNTSFGDANATIPRIFLFYREKMLDLTGMQTADQLKSIMDEEISNLDNSEKIIAVAYN
ncbi:hydantoinase/oxoprolinase family protein [Vagococcus sp. BWB3-3]|uniref:Hydantoinase/oxoprolinase family protein n=1 Tax=Vagococcus allomyrinae TaxID=2794353 RepID=A0A940P8Z1_9ENTE|nr:hydantoinase/oxoprolinase family protein [Vagococcus allomyrinae]MBP1040285.1 hydantoinase/oxoprolinase family protein [Vagococcus allomyrinae]